MKMSFAIRLSFMFKVVSISEGLVTSGTDKASRMPLATQSRNGVVSDGLFTTRAFGCKHAKVAIFAVSLIIFVMKSIFAKIITTVKTDKTFRMPILA